MKQVFAGRDPGFWIAMSCGPLFWTFLWIFGFPLQSPGRVLAYWPQFLLVMLIYPVLEEIVFRGGLQGWCLDKWPGLSYYGISVANLLTSLVFASLHFFYHPPLWAASVFLPSLVFGYFRERHGNLVSPVILHVFYNSGYALLFMRF